MILASSVLSFARALEAVYLGLLASCRPRRTRPFAGASRGWPGFCLYLVVLTPLRERAGDPLAQRLVAAAGAGALFLWTPYVLLGTARARGVASCPPPPSPAVRS